MDRRNKQVSRPPKRGAPVPPRKGLSKVRTKCPAQFKKYLCVHGNACGYCRLCGDKPVYPKRRNPWDRYVCQHTNALGYCRLCGDVEPVIVTPVVPEVLHPVQAYIVTLGEWIVHEIQEETQVPAEERAMVVYQPPAAPTVPITPPLTPPTPPPMPATQAELAVAMTGELPIEAEDGPETYTKECGCVVRSMQRRILETGYDIIARPRRVRHAMKEVHECGKCELTRLSEEYKIDFTLLSAIAWIDLGMPVSTDEFRSSKYIFKTKFKEIMGETDDAECYDQFLRCKKALAHSTWAEKAIWFEYDRELQIHNDRGWMNNLFSSNMLPSGWWSQTALASK
jgi:hypothetical protein